MSRVQTASIALGSPASEGSQDMQKSVMVCETLAGLEQKVSCSVILGMLAISLVLADCLFGPTVLS